MENMGMDGKGLKRGVMWKLHNEKDPGCPQECVGDFDNVRGSNTSDGGSDRNVSTNSNVHTNTSNSVIIRKRERSREAAYTVGGYADIARGNIG